MNQAGTRKTEDRKVVWGAWRHGGMEAWRHGGMEAWGVGQNPVRDGRTVGVGRKEKFNVW